MIDDSHIQLIVHKENEPIKQRLTRVETQVEGVMKDMAEIKDSVKDVKIMITGYHNETVKRIDKHLKDEQGVWNNVRGKVNWLMGILVGLGCAGGLLAALNHLGLIGGV